MDIKCQVLTIYTVHVYQAILSEPMEDEGTVVCCHCGIVG